jgi:hypothetical protein
MKKLKFLSLAVVLFFFTSCREKIELSLDKNSVEFAAEGGEVLVNLTSNGDWTIDECPEWISLNAQTGSGDFALKLSATENFSDLERSGVVKIATDDADAQIAVTQGFFEEDYISVNPAILYIESNGDTVSVYVSTNTSWTVDCPYSWVVPEKTDGVGSDSLTLIIQPNTLGDSAPRTASLKIISEGAEANVEILQKNLENPQIMVSPSSMEISYEGGEKVLTVASNCSWTMTCPEWITSSTLEGEGNMTITLQISANEALTTREENVVLSASTNQVYVHVKQAGAPDPHFLEINPSETNFPKEGGSLDVTVGCDVEWNVGCPNEWIAITNAQGSGDGSFRITVSENAFNIERSARVAVVSGDLRKTLMVRQAAGDVVPNLEVYPDSLTISYLDTTFFVTVTSNVQWTVASSVEWAVPSVGGGQNDGTFGIAISKNYSQRPRICNVVVTSGSLSKTITIRQNSRPSPFLTLDTSIINASAQAGEYTINVSSNLDWDVLCSSWLTVSPKSGHDNGSIVVTIPDNNSPFVRKGEVVVSSGDDYVEKVMIVQDGQTK